MTEVRLPGGVTIRPLAGVEEYRACVALQEEVWGKGFSERVPSAILMIANRLGGLSAGAFDPEGRLVGFVFGLTGIEGGEPVHWSDMLAVRPGLRDTGLGTRLKAYQREVLLARGVRRMYWTFDPLQSRNAYLNLAKLGIVVREYLRDLYGQTDSPLHRGIGTDRLLALWLMDTPRVAARLAGEERGAGAEALEEAEPILEVRVSGSDPVPGRVDRELSGPLLSLAIPGDVGELMARDLALAVRWREATREAFLAYLPRGYEVRELVRAGALSHYLLVRREAAGAGEERQEIEERR